MNPALKNVPLKRLGHVVAYHEARAKEGIEKRRHSSIAKEYRGIITALFLERLSAGDYDVESQSA